MATRLQRLGQYERINDSPHARALLSGTEPEQVGGLLRHADLPGLGAAAWATGAGTFAAARH